MVDEKGTIFTLSNKSKTEYLNAIIGKTYKILHLHNRITPDIHTTL